MPHSTSDARRPGYVVCHDFTQRYPSGRTKTTAQLAHQLSPTRTLASGGRQFVLLCVAAKVTFSASATALSSLTQGLRHLFQGEVLGWHATCVARPARSSPHCLRLDTTSHLPPDRRHRRQDLFHKTVAASRLGRFGCTVTPTLSLGEPRKRSPIGSTAYVNHGSSSLYCFDTHRLARLDGRDRTGRQPRRPVSK